MTDHVTDLCGHSFRIITVRDFPVREANELLYIERIDKALSEGWVLNTSQHTVEGGGLAGPHMAWKAHLTTSRRKARKNEPK